MLPPTHNVPVTMPIQFKCLHQHKISPHLRHTQFNAPQNIVEKHPKKVPVSSNESDPASDADLISKKPKDTLCIAKEQPLVANALAAVHENEQAMNTTTSPPKNEDEALSQEVYEILKRSYS